MSYIRENENLNETKNSSFSLTTYCLEFVSVMSNVCFGYLRNQVFLTIGIMFLCLLYFLFFGPLLNNIKEAVVEAHIDWVIVIWSVLNIYIHSWLYVLKGVVITTLVALVFGLVIFISEYIQVRWMKKKFPKRMFDSHAELFTHLIVLNMVSTTLSFLFF